MTSPHPDDPLYDDWQLIQDYQYCAAADAAEDRAASDDPWEINDDAGANKALRRIARAEAEIERITAIANDEVSRVNQWKTSAINVTRGPKDNINFYTAHLVDYRRRLEEADPQLPKTYKLPAGDLTRRKGATRIEVVDEVAFLNWALFNDMDLIARKPLVSRLKDQKDRYRPLPPDGDESVERTTAIVTVNGEVVPGVQQVVAPETYGVKAR